MERGLLTRVMKYFGYFALLAEQSEEPAEGIRAALLRLLAGGAIEPRRPVPSLHSADGTRPGRPGGTVPHRADGHPCHSNALPPLRAGLTSGLLLPHASVQQARDCQGSATLPESAGKTP